MAGLGTTVEARASAMLSGQHALWKAASRTVTVGSGEGRPRGWRAPWGPPDVGSQPQMLELGLITVITIRMRREEGSRIIPLSPTSLERDGRGKGTGTHILSSVIGSTDGMVSGVVTALAHSSAMPPPSAPPPRGDTGHTTWSSATATRGSTGQGGGQPPGLKWERWLSMAVIPMAAAKVVTVAVGTATVMDGDGMCDGLLIATVGSVVTVGMTGP